MLNGKRILVTGACGTVGAELTRQLVEAPGAPLEIRAIDNNESELFFLERRFSSDARVQCRLADVRDRDRLRQVMQGIDVVFHAAAFKHVIMCEKSPFEAVQTNIIGVENVMTAACDNNVERVIFTSSDKAVNPTSVMGTSKLMGEKLMTAANSNLQGEGPIFASTRFGNVLGSRGSVIPVFQAQIQKGGPVTLTDPRMTRFIMSIEQAVRLVIDSASQAQRGDVFITKMPVVRIEDLARVMIEEFAPRCGRDPSSIEIVTIGARPGEKMYEELMNSEETRRAVELEKYFVVTPPFRGFDTPTVEGYTDVLSATVDNPYISDNEPPMTTDDIRTLLHSFKLITT